MKKIMLVLITCVVIITGCSLNNTPNSKVEELLGKYQGLDNSISISSYPITKREDLDDDIEKELGIEIVGDTKVKVAVEEDEEPWDVIDDNEYTDEVDKEIDKNVKEDYLEKK